MEDNNPIIIIYGKEDIKKDCKYCIKTDKKHFMSGAAYGYECILTREHRNCNRCKTCYFGRHYK